MSDLAKHIIILSVIEQYLVAFKRQRLPGKLHLDGCEVPTRGQAGLWGSPVDRNASRGIYGPR